LVLSLAACSREPAFPKAEAPVRRHDFGAVVQGKRVEHAFEIRNAGGAELVIEEIKVPEVLTVESFDRVVPPGGSGRVRVELDTSGVHGPGKLVVRVYTNDPGSPETVLRLDGRVVRAIEVEPRDRIYFFKAPGEGGEERVTLVRYGDRAVAVTGVSCDSPRFRPNLKPLAPGERYELTVTLDPSTPAGKYEATVTAATDSPDLPKVEIPVRALIDEKKPG
jgi:Protein of unknown function (DUF1573)